MIKAKKAANRLSQGDIYRGVEFIEYAEERAGVIEVSKIGYPLVIVLTQDCDLEQDHNYRKSSQQQAHPHDKWLLSVLVAPLYNVEHVFLGQHLSNLNLQMQQIDKKSTRGKLLLKNEIPRYHFLEFPHPFRIAPSVIDFKHYFCVNVRYLHQVRKSSFVCSVSSLYREDISDRFAAFLSRIGLPNPSNP